MNNRYHGSYKEGVKTVKKIISILMCVIILTLPNNIYAQNSGNDIKERIKRQKESSKSNMTDTIFVKAANPKNCKKILKEALPGYEYTVEKYYDLIQVYTVKFQTVDDADTAVDILNERNDIIYAQNDYATGYATPVEIFPPLLPKDTKNSKTREMDILNKNGIIVGDPDGDLRENDEITRAEFAAVLCCAMGCENETENDDLKQKNYFPDVPPEHWASGYINYAYENGAINGFTDGKFYPEEKVTNEQAVKMLIGAWGYGTEAEKNGGYPDGYLKIAKENGIFNTIEFDNKNASKRWVASVFVYGVLSMPAKNPVVNPPIKTVPISFENIRNENEQ